jgi:hypothetical protein
MVQSSNQCLTLEEFLALPEGDITYEFVNGEAVPKYKDNEMSPKFFMVRLLVLYLYYCLHGHKQKVEL